MSTSIASLHSSATDAFGPEIFYSPQSARASSTFEWLVAGGAKFETMRVRFTPAKGSFVLDDLAKRLLGPNGVSRLDEFSQYPAGWDSGSGRQLDPRSISLLNAFADLVPSISRASLFMTRDGNLSLGWSTNTGSEVELEFAYPNVEWIIERADGESIEGGEDATQFLADAWQEIASRS